MTPHPAPNANQDRTRPVRIPIAIASVLFSLLALGACSRGPAQTGFIEGHVTIGPLVPVMRQGELPPTPSAEVYAARQIVVYERDGRSEFTRLHIDSRGNYRGELPIGIYVIDINRVGIDSAAGLPAQIEITTAATVRLDIDIDTGNR